MIKNIKFFTITFLILAFLVVAILFLWKFDQNSSQNKIEVKIDKTVIVQKVKALNKLETTEIWIQRDLEVTLDLGKFELFGVQLLQNKRTQKIAVTGKVVAGVDFSKVSSDKINYDSAKNSIAMELPTSEVFSVNLQEDKMYILKDDLSLLFSLYNLSTSNRNELNQELQKQVIKQSKLALLDGACEDGIIQKANAEAQNNLKNLFIFTKVDNFTFTFGPENTCKNADV